MPIYREEIRVLTYRNVYHRVDRTASTIYTDKGGGGKKKIMRNVAKLVILDKLEARLNICSRTFVNIPVQQTDIG